MSVLSVAFVDDHPILLSGMVHMFDSNPDFSITGVGKCAEDLLEIVASKQPDVVVTDLNMPGDVMVAIGKITRGKSGTKVLVFTAVTAVEHAIAALEAGAKGYVLKGSQEDELEQAIRTVHAGETFVTPNFAASVVAGIRTAALRQAATVALRLSIREEQVLRLLLLGKTNREIGAALKISDKTVKHYMTLLMQRLNARNRIEVVLAAQELGIDAKPPDLHALN